MLTLTIKDRYDLRKYAGALPCTLSLRYAIEDFQRQVDFTPDEMTQYAIKVNKDTFEVECNDSSYAVQYESIPEAVAHAMKDYVTHYDVEQTKDNVITQNTIKAFKKVL